MVFDDATIEFNLNQIDLVNLEEETQYVAYPNSLEVILSHILELKPDQRLNFQTNQVEHIEKSDNLELKQQRKLNN